MGTIIKTYTKGFYMDNKNKDVQGLLDLIKFAEDFIKEEDAKADALIKQINGEDAFLWRQF